MGNKIYVTPENDPRDYVGYDLFGYPFNKKYPPDKTRYGQAYEGYANKTLGVLLYDFCVMGYDVELSFKGKNYYFMDVGEGVVTDSHFTERKEVFDNPMALVENFKIDGKTLLELAPEIEDIGPV
ncbi:hypothetical protein [Bacteroides acidifaciens]|uniref:hypothetical protein n=1 Tax=Bacteroides acidifaciens TaxID=85831 RepID=UPI002677297A|nr:hypothetical protein [Bacteroides acidifaciens]